MTSPPVHEDHDFTVSLLEWFDKHGRKSLPWQENSDPYPIWVSEIMLQQTQVDTVIPYFHSFMARFPDIFTLAKAPQDTVMEEWAGLGYYARARNLHRAAQVVCDRYNGVFPKTLEDVISLPGIGRSTAGAILAFSRNARHPILDGNVKRVLARYFTIEGNPARKQVENQLWETAERLTPHRRVGDYTQAIMDLGATVCTNAGPKCEKCPVQPGCQAYRENTVLLFPQPRPGKKRPLKHTRMLVIRNSGDCYLLVKRPPTGIWGGLWSLPQLDDETTDCQQYCRNILGIEITAGRRQAVIRHGFTHFDLDIEPVLCESVSESEGIMDAGEYLWYNPSLSRKIGMPAAVVKILNSSMGE